MPLLDDGHHMAHHHPFAHAQHPHAGASGFHNMSMHSLNHFNMAAGHYMTHHHDKYSPFHCPPKIEDPTQTLNLVKNESLAPPYFYPTMDALPVTSHL